MTRLLSTAVMMLVEALVREIGMARARQVRMICWVELVFPRARAGSLRRVRQKSHVI